MTSGRKTKLTPEMQERICNMIRLGNYRNVAAQSVGVHPDTMTRWMSRPRNPYRRFRQAVEEAEAVAEAAMVGLIAKAAREDPKYALQYLARKHPERWAQRQFTGALDSKGQPTEQSRGVLVVPGIMDPDEWQAAAEQYKKFQPTWQEVEELSEGPESRDSRTVYAPQERVDAGRKLRNQYRKI